MNAIPNECLFEILNNFRTSHGILFSCLFVNRQWCENAVQILWSEPNECFKERRLIKIYLSLLNSKEQALLIPFDIILPKKQNRLFDYSSFTQSIIGFNLIFGIINWLKNEGH
ncbi:8875_t:CDS:1, partial [Ambispora leptoticha]